MLALVAGASSAGFPALHFACNTTGPENTTQLRQLARYDTVIFEFRQQCCGGDPWTHAEAIMETQAKALAKDTGKRAWVYRNINAGSVFALQRSFMFDPKNDALFIGPAGVDPHYNLSWRALNFSVPAAADWYINTVVAEAAAESAGAVAGVFFDNVDGDACSAALGSTQLFNDTIRTMGRACRALAKAGKGCVLSTANAFAGPGRLANSTGDSAGCPQPEEAMVELLHGTPWSRYYQHWMNGFVAHRVAGPTLDQTGPRASSWPVGSTASARCSAMVANAVLEGARGIPIVARAPSAPSVYTVGLELALAGWMMGAGAPLRAGPGREGAAAAAAAANTGAAAATAATAAADAGAGAVPGGSSFGFGACWFDRCWQWPALYDQLGHVGAPTGPAEVSAGGMRFRRRWEGVDVELDCADGSAVFHMRHAHTRTAAHSP